MSRYDHPPACGTADARSFGERSYFLRMPNHASCTAGHALPLVVLVHCYGCVASMEVSKYEAAADALGFALAALEGRGRSFNAPHCCGPAHDERADDIGFVDGLVDELLSPPSRFVASALFAAGFSNGGFLVSHLAQASRHAWAGVSPAAGHEYNVQRGSPLAIALHHCEADNMVNASGCCTNAYGVPTCCCGIVAPRCVSTRSIFERWLHVNKCDGTRDVPTHHLPPGAAACVVGTGCAAATSLCWHGPHCHHGGWAREFPAAHSVLAFFAHRVCERHGGAKIKCHEHG